MLKFVFVIVGTFIGAGFASGKEIDLFFFGYGRWGSVGVVISSALIGIILYKSLKIIKQNYIQNFDEFVDVCVKNEIIRVLFKNIIKFFLIMSFCVMISAFCEFLCQEFCINKFVSHILVLLICFIIFRKNAEGVTKLNNYFIPIAVMVVIYIFAFKVDKMCIINYNESSYENFKIGLLLKSIIYASYNLLSIVPIAVGIHALLNRKRDVRRASILSTIVIAGLSAIIFFVLFQSVANSDLYALSLEIPTVYIIGKYGQLWKIVYSSVIGIAILTTAVSAGYSYLQKYEESKEKYNKQMIYLMLGTVLSVRIGFSNLVQVLYPLFGIIGMLQSICIIKKR